MSRRSGRRLFDKRETPLRFTDGNVSLLIYIMIMIELNALAVVLPSVDGAAHKSLTPLHFSFKET